MKGLTIYLLSVVALFAAHFILGQSLDNHRFEYSNEQVNITSLAPPSIQTYEYFMSAAEKYNIPRQIVLGILKLETTFKHPLDLKYNPHRTSSAKAYGPAQVQLATARWVMGDNSITREDLLYNIELNAEISMKYIRMLFNRYHDWNTALGFYNTGYAVVNDYATKITKRQ